MIYREEMIGEKVRLEKTLKCIEEEMKKLQKQLPEGVRLRAAKHGKGYQYFIRSNPTEKTGKYIKKNDMKIAVALAQFEYYENLIAVLNDQIKRISELTAIWRDDPFAEVKAHLPPGKQQIVTMPYVSDKEYVSQWMSREYEKLPFREGAPEYYTKQNLRVRSKSEVIIAETLSDAKIAFLYEKPLSLKDRTVYPDFTLLDIKKRKEVYWEHFGMMDDVDYRNGALAKIRQYEDNGLFQNDRVIWTFETSKNPINIAGIRNMIKKYKAEFCW